jgi:hypothetical protein
VTPSDGPPQTHAARPFDPATVDRLTARSHLWARFPDPETLPADAWVVGARCGPPWRLELLAARVTTVQRKRVYTGADGPYPVVWGAAHADALNVLIQAGIPDDDARRLRRTAVGLFGHRPTVLTLEDVRAWYALQLLSA